MISNMTPIAKSSKKSILIESIKEPEEFYIIKDYNAYKFIKGELDNNIIIKCKKYKIIFNNNDLSILTKSIIKHN